jgi:hypothetical protein
MAPLIKSETSARSQRLIVAKSLDAELRQILKVEVWLFKRSLPSIIFNLPRYIMSKMLFVYISD